ncbi:MAG: GNAT family N-acetyltransferase [Firmicutes bacterium]|nr:GNAT family N-acetyltransferase [Bacillota bacterium]
MIQTKDSKFMLRFAEDKDLKLILTFIKELADYENLLDQVMATEEILYNSLFEKKEAEVLIGEYDNEPVGFALFFQNFSTFVGRSGIHLEDLYVKPEMRGKGLGKIMLSEVAKIAVERGCRRLEWWCLDWNEPSIKFYKSLGATAMDELTVYRLSDKSLKGFASNSD